MKIRITSKQARDHALEVVESNASPIFRERAERVVRKLAQHGESFTTDQVWDDLAGIYTAEPRALGAVMTRLAKAGIIEKTGTYVPSSRMECHARPIPVWIGTALARESA